jgi:hypothetical protein
VGPGVVVHGDGPGGAGGAGGELAFTGSRPEKTALISAGLLVVGCGCIFVSSRRRRGRRGS